MQASSGAFKASCFFFPVAFAWGSSSSFPKALAMEHSRLSKSRQEFVNGSGSVVLLPVDAASHNSNINISGFLGQEAFGFLSVSTITEGLMNLISQAPKPQWQRWFVQITVVG